MVESKITEEKLVNTKLYRDKAISRVDVLDKVKDLFLIPELETVSMRMIADYYEVDIEVVKKCYQNNNNEIDSDGVVHKSYSELETVLQGNNIPTKICHGKLEAKLSDVVTLSIPHTGLKLFSKRAVLRFGMLLRDSKIAKEVRTQLLNVFEHSTNEQKTKEIDEEKQLLIDISLAYASGDVNRLLPATMKYQNYKNRYTKQIEDKNKKLETENKVLAQKALEWGNKPVLNALIRKYACTCFKGKYKFADAWDALYRQIKYKYSIDIKARKGNGRLIDRIKDNEFVNVIQVAGGLCVANNIDVGKTVNEINEENIKSLK
jgi:hypothetical protein